MQLEEYTMTEQTSTKKMEKLADQRIGVALVGYQAELTANGPRCPSNNSGSTTHQNVSTEFVGPLRENK